MRPRLRVLSVLFALLAFSASVAEGVWASTCATMELDAAGGGAMSMPMDGMGDEHSSDAPQQDGAPDDERDCPLPALAGSGCIVVSLPSGTIRVDLTTAEDSGVALGGAELSDRLAISNLFHPPQQ